MAYVEMDSSEIRKVYFEDGNIPLLCGFSLLNTTKLSVKVLFLNIVQMSLQVMRCCVNAYR